MSGLAIVWTIAGTDSGGGAGIAADQRAADACGVHLCTAVAAVTAQNSQGVRRIDVLPPATLAAQLATLEHDLPPAAIKTGLLGGPQQVALVAEWIDRLRQRAPVALVVDPVLSASTGADFADDATLAAYRALLLPRATLITPNRREAARLAGLPEASAAPLLAAALRSRGAHSVCVTGGDDTRADGLALDWMDTPQAAGWLALPRLDTPHHHGTGCTFASAAAAAMAQGFVAADALVLAKMATAQALRHGSAAGQGAGPVRARAGFATDASLMPQMSWSAEPCFAPFSSPAAWPALGLYAIVDSAGRVARVLEAGVRTVQLRIKTPPGPDPAWRAQVRQQIAEAVARCREHGAMLFVNDHHALAAELGASGLHLGQEDLLALDDGQRLALRADGAPALGISSHSLWELARARSLAPRYIACGPVWPTLTKQMPWRAQGLDNLAWWVAMAGAPVVAIGGILEPAQAEAAAARGADGVCVVRGLGDAPSATVPAFLQALRRGAGAARPPLPPGPRPSL
ncbi:bifunctional hydroxymethylpyrimidine kinase/phosphomethylpyrimidine kinase [Xylophilus rhododendri]|uniref:hydroxymethylpyrimidine kinase n=1 Tax=Xylophilus rhododendri TaxID=2697032 RepID=A0A857J5L7_9BURK|nr:bifunctional hydroxymethylpyrimidine kinase/phosphomethylpyrimidine kinase [Xylophilus rhododendri]QHI99294.1 bifunctional hydroxymethylpyrimidine kinase/phosphomethylpyrimidine kinase [Xylophilus rhododendri]